MRPTSIITHPQANNKLWPDVNLLSLHRRRPRWLASQAELWRLYSMTGRAFYSSNTNLWVSIPLKTPETLKALQVTNRHKCLEVRNKDTVFLHDMLGHIQYTKSRSNLRVLIGKFLDSPLILWIWHRVISLSSAKEITRRMPIHHWSAGEKCH